MTTVISDVDQAIEFKSAYGYLSFAHGIVHRNRYIRDPETEEFLRTVLQLGKGREEARIRKNKGFWRAQAGCDWGPAPEDDRQQTSILLFGPPDREAGAFSPERMKPLVGQAREGRANPKGIPCLYGATKKKTALAEVRPWLGQPISLAFFVFNRDVKLINFVTPDPVHMVYFIEPEPKERERRVWADIDRAFAEPVTPNDEVADYAPTQVIAEPQIHHLFLPGLRRQPEKAAPDKSYSENGIKERLSGEFCHSGIV